jgi:hypothetical protein
MKKLIKFPKKTIIVALTSSLLLLPVISFADNPPPFPTPTPPVDYAAIAKAVENAVGNVLIYPMEQLAQVIKYTFDTRPVDSSLKTQSRFPQLPYVEGMAAANDNALNEVLNKMSNTPSIDSEAQLANQSNQVCSGSTCYSNTSANTLLGSEQYSSIEQQAAAQQFLKTASGAYIGATPPDPAWNSKDPDAIKYTDFYKTMNAVQSVAQHNLTYAYSIRTAADDSHPSALNLYNQILTGDSKNAGFWQSINKVPVVSQLVTIANELPAIAVGIQQQNKYLEMINSSLAAMLVQQNILVQSFAGKSLYSSAQLSATNSQTQQAQNNAPPQPNNPYNNPDSGNYQKYNNNAPSDSGSDQTPTNHSGSKKPAKKKQKDDQGSDKQ